MASNYLRVQAEEPTQDIGRLRLIGEDVLIDDQDASLILVFPRSKAAGGVVDEEEEVEDPLEECKKIFVRKHNHATDGTLQKGFERLENGPVSVRVYQEVIRERFLALLQRTAFKVSTFESIDKDEVFMKIALDREGEVIKQLAERYEYSMPFKAEAYRSARGFGGKYKGGEPMRNKLNMPVPAYTNYKQEISDLLQDFRPVDEIRIIETRLYRWINLAEMQKQGIIVRWFPGAKYQSVKALSATWANLRSIFTIPSYGQGGQVRDYFGEEITFFFRWFAFYTRMLLPLAAFAVFIEGLEHLDLGFEEYCRPKFLFSIALVFWSSCFNKLFKNRMARARQEWGMKDYDTFSHELKGYRPELEGTWNLWLRRNGSLCIVVIFCVCFALLIYYLELFESGGEDTTENPDKVAQNINHSVAVSNLSNSVILVGIMKLASFLWGVIAPKLVDLQNRRTQARWNDAMTWMLVAVKLFIALWPFLRSAFVQRYVDPECLHGTGPSVVRALAIKIWNEQDSPEHPWPKNALDYLTTRFVYEELDKEDRIRTCVYGCIPASPLDSVPGGRTNCFADLQRNLATFYAFHAAFTVLFLLIPIILTRLKVKWEIKKARDMFDEDSDDENGQEESRYTFLQFQAKCFTYEYGSWGGSLVEDFLELAVGFAMITCFGVCMPTVAVFGLVANIIEYRLLAYRMTNITCRPMPAGAEGIGLWQSVFEFIAVLAVVCNVGLVIYHLPPFRRWSRAMKLLFFVIAEHIMLALKALVGYMIPDEPEDVRLIEDFNAQFVSTLVNYPPLKTPASEKYDYSKVDIGLEPGELRPHAADLAEASSNLFQTFRSYPLGAKIVKGS